MAIDPAYGNSSGYFRDPVSGEELSVDTPRVIPCSLENGKFTWPCVACSDGSQLLKIVYKYFTEEEKDLYKQYRGRSSSGSSERKPREAKPKATVKPTVNEVPIDERELVKFSPDCVMNNDTREILDKCDQIIGISQIAGLTYALCTASNSNKIYHIPRALIPDADFNRMFGGN